MNTYSVRVSFETYPRGAEARFTSVTFVLMASNYRSACAAAEAAANVETRIRDAAEYTRAVVTWAADGGRAAHVYELIPFDNGRGKPSGIARNNLSRADAAEYIKSGLA